ncbi:MAG: nucleotidyltransferase [Nitrospira sp.]|nr:MAG: nucleotidyltransferase [Nitrospira sp.]
MSDKLRNLLRLLGIALTRLEGALAQPVNEFVRDSAIQRFEFTFELFWKSLKGYAEESGVEAYSPRDSLRTAFQLGVIQENSDWFQMLQDRNLTSHTYNEVTAETIYSHLSSYLLLIRQAHAELTRRIKS